MRKYNIKVMDYVTKEHHENVRFLLSALNCVNAKYEYHDDEEKCTVFEVEVKTDKHAELIMDLSNYDYFSASDYKEKIQSAGDDFMNPPIED